MTILGKFLLIVAAGATAALVLPAAAADGGDGYVKPQLKHEPYGELRIVVPLTTDDQAVQRVKLANIQNALKAADVWQGKVTIKVVLYFRGVRLLMDPDQTVRSKLDDLRAHGVQIEVCNYTLADAGIDFHKLYGVTDADIVPSGFAEVAYLQTRQHYAVDPMN